MAPASALVQSRKRILSLVCGCGEAQTLRRRLRVETADATLRARYRSYCVLDGGCGVSASEIFDGLQHLGHERDTRTDERRTRRLRAHANGRIVWTETACIQR